KGFRDLLAIGRQKRPSLYDLQADKTPVLVDRDLRFEIRERMDYTGSVLDELSDEAVDEVLDRIGRAGVQSVAVMFLNAYLNPDHEQKLQKRILERFPGVFLTISSDLSRQFREYERLCGTVLNSFVGPEVRKYMTNLQNTLADIGIRNAYINHSNGGLMSIAESMTFPIKTGLSGPAAGVVGAQYICDLIGEKDLITMDIGGTSTDLSLVAGGRFEASDERAISGYPVRIPSIDISTIGAGGGSIAWIDSGGVLKVGPQSAGADPGPACYGLGGQDATITDARVVLGHLNSSELLGGRLPISAEKSFEAVQRLADRLGLGLFETAKGIVSISNANIIREIRNVTVAKGYDPGEFCMVAFGGSGPLHAAELIEEMQIGKALIPKAPGLLAAYGLLTENMRRDFVQTYIIELDADSSAVLDRVYGMLQQEAAAWFEQEDIPRERRSREYFLDMRYKGQNHEIRVPLREEEICDAGAIQKAFTEAYQRLYSFASGDAVQIVNFGLSAIGNIVHPAIEEDPYAGEDPSAARTGVRLVRESEDAFTEYALYDRSLLHHGNVIPGPAIIEQMDSTTIVLPGYKATVDRYLNMMIERK
nr:hydantoinase/oxoprolinase family protein [Clostridia bacterium]